MNILLFLGIAFSALSLFIIIHVTKILTEKGFKLRNGITALGIKL
jgi:cell division protein FtsL